MNLRARIEKALAAYIADTLTIAVSTGQSADMKPDDSVVVYCESANVESPIYAQYGNFLAVVKVMVASNANDVSLSDHADKVASVEVCLFQLASINTEFAAEDLHAYAINFKGHEEAQAGERFVSTISLEIPVVDNPQT